MVSKIIIILPISLLFCLALTSPLNFNSNGDNGSYVIEILHSNFTSKVYLSNIEDGIVEAGVKVSVFNVSNADILLSDTFSFESQSTDRQLTISSQGESSISTLAVHSSSPNEQWTLTDGPTSYCMQNVASGQYLNVITTTSPFAVQLSAACDAKFQFINVTEVSVQVSQPTPYHLKAKHEDAYLDNENKYQVTYNQSGDLWEFLPVQNEASLNLRGFESQNMFIESYFETQPFAAINDKMQRWYIIKGDGIDEVCILNQKWGSFVHPTNTSIQYPETKSALCDEGDKFALTDPVVTNFTEGLYKITSTANSQPYNLMNSVEDVVRGSDGTGLWEITSHLQVTYKFRSISTNQYIEANNGNVETSNQEIQWHLIQKTNDKYCLQDVDSRQYLSITQQGVVELVNDCVDGEFEFQRYRIANQVQGQKLIRYHQTQEESSYVNFGIYEAAHSIHSHSKFLRIIDQEYLEMEGLSIEVGKTDDNWLLVQEYEGEIEKPINCILEMHSGQFLEFNNLQIESSTTCAGSFSFLDINVQTIPEGTYTIQNPVSNYYFYLNPQTNDFSVLNKINLWNIHDSDDQTYSLQSFSNLEGVQYNSSSEALIAEAEEDRWFLFEGTTIGQYCLYNIQGKKFATLKNDQITFSLDCTDSSDEIFLTPISVATISDGDYSIRSSLSNSYIVDSTLQANDAIGIWNIRMDMQEKSYTLKTSASESYLGVSIDGTSVVQEFKSQGWVFIQQVNNEYCLLNIDTSQYITLSSSALSTSTTCNNGEFSLQPVSFESFNDNDHFIIKNIQKNKNLLHTKAHNMDVVLSDNIGIWKFGVQTHYGVAIQSLASSSFISMDNNGATQCYTYDQWFVVSGNTTNSTCFLNVRKGKYLSVDNGNKLSFVSDCSLEAEFQLSSITVHDNVEGIFNIKGIHTNHYLNQETDDSSVLSTSTIGLWELSQRGTIESQYGDREYLTINNLDQVGTSTRLDHWVLVNYGNTLLQVCILNLENGLYLQVHENFISSSTNCGIEQAVVLSQVSLNVFENFQYKIYKIDAMKYVGSQTSGSLGIYDTPQLWEVKQFFDRTHFIKSVDSEEYLTSANSSPHDILVSESFDDNEEWYFINSGNGKHCILNAKTKKFVSMLDNGNDIYSIVTSETCEQNEQFQIVQ